MLSEFVNGLQTTQEIDNDKFDPARQQDIMAKLGILLSHNATKFSLACKPPRQPQDAIRMVKEMSDTIYRLIGFYQEIPLNAGKVYHATYRRKVQELLRATHHLCQTFLPEDKKEKASFMVPTATLWDLCKTLNGLPASNARAVIQEWKLLMDTLKDCKEEVHNVVDNGVDDFEGEEDAVPLEGEALKVAKRCAQLVDVTVFLFRKIEKCFDKQDVTWLDNVYDQGKRVTDEADVLVSEIYDAEPNEMEGAVKQYAQHVTDLIQIAQEAINGADAKIFEMCKTKLNEIITAA
ncbi:uncharacterized protein BYT42DRAFT_558856 [Radiomyces spectabilis]|uniref:uncharacterized protein n=1 Tax=Radiomyces spectabilis TaxID=64574 RepID=UPI00222114CD|nr:uncharacterized protein BYT42DRAFT_558856 [Radiomyces spectabilis]KAI8388073.1 hypothetical protein BYT42DRAFT_558856 [Radiomyces spectabilis]